ncbi:MAG: hypothetical protein IPH41_17930 [Sulfuritalea sp.]|mgnify:CR=1 FL=1|nr:hypothetical protein [Sulfuritalea sp.]
MKLRNTLLIASWAALAALVIPTALAGEGHDHGEAPAAAGGAAAPRFSAVSETFELVGILNGKQLTLYLDRFADGSPVKGAKLELDLGGTRIAVEPHEEGEFEATLAQELKPGVIAVTATVVAGEETDLLAGELDLHDEAAGVAAIQSHGWQAYGLWAIVLVVGGFLAIVLYRRMRTARASRIGGVA